MHGFVAEGGEQGGEVGGVHEIIFAAWSRRPAA
jgi:hypothetical protein